MSQVSQVSHLLKVLHRLTHRKATFHLTQPVPLPDPPPGTCPPVPDVSTVPNPARRASEIAQKPVETSPASVEGPLNFWVHV
ncbi:MAG: hypothetical protein ACJ8DI_24780 [Ktedonobacteraceae bacterium]